MDGKVYESANDIPDRPHTNCKCHIELIEKEREITDPIEIYQEQRREKQRVILEIQKAQGDILSMTEEIDEFLKQVDEEETKLTELKSIIDINNLEKEDIEKLNKAIEQVEFARFRGEKVKKELNNLHSQAVVLEGGVEKVRILEPLLDKVLYKLGEIISSFKYFSEVVKELTIVVIKQLLKGNRDIITKLAFKILIANTYGTYHAEKYNMPEALALYKIGSPEFAYNKEYIRKNGVLYDSIDDLHDYTLEKDIHYWLYKDMKMEDCKVVKFRSDSSIAKEIEQSNTLKRFIKENKDALLKNEIIYQESVDFKNNDADLYSSIHSGVFKNAYIDKNTKILHISCEDLWDFEKRYSSWKGILGRFLQDNGLLVPYYVIIDLQIPESVWQPYLK